MKSYGKGITELASLAAGISPCKGCANRKAGCHDHCKGFADWRAKRQNIVKKMKQEALIARYDDEITHRCCELSRRFFRYGN